jgi:hypothetical protein
MNGPAGIIDGLHVQQVAGVIVDPVCMSHVINKMIVLPTSLMFGMFF